MVQDGGASVAFFGIDVGAGFVEKLDCLQAAQATGGQQRRPAKVVGPIGARAACSADREECLEDRR